jgi:homoserine dehydrogenase
VDIGPVGDLLDDESLEAVVELAGGIEEPLAWARSTLERGRTYVTGNKALLATHGGELAEIATRTGAGLLASASVGGGTPMIEMVQHLGASGRIARLRGLLNATTTFILAAMGEGRSYDEALADAQGAGYAEPDPSFDVDGRDAAQKIAILASVAWGRWRPEREVATRGIVGIPVSPGDTQRLVAEADEHGMRVEPMQLSHGDPMAAVSGVECLLEVQLRGGAVFRISGPGAGGPVSIGATYADLGRLLAGERPVMFAPPVGR